MKKIMRCLAVLFVLTAPLFARQKIQGFCEQGGATVTTQGAISTTKVQQSFPSCTVTVYNAGTAVLATIYSDNSSTPLSNPFTADTNGYWFFYASNGRYDVSISGIANPFTRGDLMANDFVTNNIYSYSVLAYADPLTIDASGSNIFALTLTGNVTSSTVTNPSVGQLLELLICQDGVGGRTFAYPADFVNNPVIPAIGSSPNACTDLPLMYDGSYWRLFGQPSGIPPVIAFTGLTDAPANYIGEAYKFPQVNAGETGLQFLAIGDCHNGTTGKLLYNSTTGAFSCGTDQMGPTVFTALTDVPASYSGKGYNLVQVNGAANALQFNALGDCSNATSSKLLYTAATGTFSCGTDQSTPVGTGITSLNGLTGGTQTFTNDTNVTVVSAGTAHVITWAGQLAKARQNAATVYNDAANTFSTGAQDFGSATSLKVPTSAGAAPTANGLISYDSTANAYKFGVNGATKQVAMIDGNVATATALAANPSNCGANNWSTGISANGTADCTQPGFSNLSGSVLPAQMPGLTGDVTSSAGGVSTTLPNIVAAGTNTKVTYNAKGQVTAGAQAQFSDIGGTVAASQASTGLKTRMITYMAGGDSAGSALDSTYSQNDVFNNQLGVTVTILSVWCKSDGGTPAINFAVAGGGANILNSNLTCTTSGATSSSLLTSSLTAGQGLDFDIISGSTAKRITAIVVYRVN